MTEQLDIFNFQEEQDNESKSELTPRQWALYRLIYENSIYGNRKTTKKEICIRLGDYGYKWNDDPKVHDHCTAIWKDIKDNNESFEHDKIIISENDTYWIGNEQETKDFIEKLWKDLCPRLCRYWNYKEKIARNGQGKLFSTKLNPINDDSRARAFVESFNEGGVEQ